MSKFTVKVELQGYEVKLQGLKFSVEGSKEDAPRIAQQIEKQLSGMIQAPTVMAPTALASGNGHTNSLVIDAQVNRDDGETDKKKKARKSGAGRPAESINLSHDSATYGSPQQGWTTVQKAIWFLHVVNKQANIAQMTAYNITKNFNKYFRAAGAIHRGNVGKYLDVERVKGQNATVGADMADGTAKYFLTQAGVAVADKLSRGEAVAAA